MMQVDLQIVDTEIKRKKFQHVLEVELLALVNFTWSKCPLVDAFINCSLVSGLERKVVEL